MNFFPLGFLYVSKDNPGNYALQDIYTALHWLKNHIIHFNGDPNRITLYGTESGAVLASLVVMLETVNGLSREFQEIGELMRIFQEELEQSNVENRSFID